MTRTNTGEYELRKNEVTAKDREVINERKSLKYSVHSSEVAPGKVTGERERRRAD